MSEQVAMPKNVRRFAWLWIGSAALTVPAIFLMPPLTPQEIKFGLTRIEEMVASGIVFVLVLAIFLPFFWLAVWRRKNWARWVLLVSFVVSVPLLFIGSPFQSDHLAMTAIGFVSSAMEALAFVFLFTGDAQPWFQKPNSK